MAKVELKGISKTFGTAVVLKEFNLAIEEGEFFCLVGPSGCGKSTILNLIAGLEAPTFGHILFDGKEVGRLGPRPRDVAMVFQSYALYPHKSVYENIAFPLRIRGMDRGEIRTQVEKITSLLGLSDLLQRMPKQLSGGQQQRVALGRALVRQPKVFLMDEPLSNLDAQLRTQMRLEIKKLHKAFPVTTVYVTHDQEEAMSLSDRMAVLRLGQIQQVGTPMEVYRRPANLFVARFIGKPTINILESDQIPKNILNGPLPEGKAWVGIRPEHVKLGKGSGGVRARIEVVEPMGSEAWIEVALGDLRLMAKHSGNDSWKVGTSVQVSWEPEDPLFFSLESETLVMRH